MSTTIPKETVRLSKEVAEILEKGLDNPTINRGTLLIALGKLADIIVLNTEEK